MKKRSPETNRKFIPYYNQLKDNRWKRKAEQIKHRDNFTCSICGTDSLPVIAHHLFYISGCYAWEYSNDCLISVCDPCHKDIHDKHKEALYCPCVCDKCGVAITNKNCNTVARIGDYFRFKIYCDVCLGVDNE